MVYSQCRTPLTTAIGQSTVFWWKCFYPEASEHLLYFKSYATYTTDQCIEWPGVGLEVAFRGSTRRPSSTIRPIQTHTCPYTIVWWNHRYKLSTRLSQSKSMMTSQPVSVRGKWNLGPWGVSRILLFIHLSIRSSFLLRKEPQFCPGSFHYEILAYTWIISFQGVTIDHNAKAYYGNPLRKKYHRLGICVNLYGHVFIQMRLACQADIGMVVIYVQIESIVCQTQIWGHNLDQRTCMVRGSGLQPDDRAHTSMIGTNGAAYFYVNHTGVCRPKASTPL